MPAPAFATCGAAFCTTNTSWDVQGAWQEPGARFDLRFEAIKQDQPMSGSRRIAVGELPRHHDEIVTRNDNWLPSVDYTIDADWGVNAAMPIVHRGHEHLHNHGGGQLLETWNFTQLGDARVVARRRLFSSEHSDTHSLATAGATFGLKLPTGRTDVRNSEGDLAERTLQPGTGTTDLLAGLYYSQALPASDLAWFVQGQLQQPLHSYQDYRPGARLMLDTGVRYLATEKASLMVQLNYLVRGRDGGAQAEPGDSGGRSLSLSPGASYAITPSFQVYGFIQLPLYQHVNGVQLTARRAVAIGISSRF